MVDVAALYVDARGPYVRMPGVDAWDITRDARLYDGPLPVVAHPPCRNYSRQRHQATGDDSDCALIAARQVRTFGGVLEHPAGSTLFDRFRPGYLPWPGDLGDVSGSRGYTVEVDQVEWGHVARKRTWLYLVGIPRGALEPPPLSGSAAHALVRRRTHAEFAPRRADSRRHQSRVVAAEAPHPAALRRIPREARAGLALGGA